ncbi:protocadherin-11 x-linked [Plakobranchus ocellatus]|uniref:Protocadherin-11 x-linked n=1 Tax=Plakobranchus ocellatus TaxID=259542 RepID=A0AAV4ASK0_9GAST|nr:protocadherin-11 x-linked [Plakobranchus ocellatus]
MALSSSSSYEVTAPEPPVSAKQTITGYRHGHRRRASLSVHITRQFFLGITAALLLCNASVAKAQGPKELFYRYREEQSSGTYVGNIARDSQIYNQYTQEQFDKLEYRIPDELNKFTIDKKTSTLRTAQVIDREEECLPGSLQPGETCAISFDSSVFSTNDDGGFDLLQIIKVTITVLDINDNPPKFPSNKTTLDIPESVEVGEVLHTSAARDDDAGPNNTVKEYRLEGGEGIFELQDMSSSGVTSQNGALLGTSSTDLGIVLKQKLDRETTSSYSLTIVAVDGGIKQLTGSVDITINVLDANDNRPAFESSSFTADVPEDSPQGSTVLSLVASDSDAEQNGRIEFSFSTPTPVKVSEYFGINATTGAIYLAKALDYEKDRRFAFSVTVTDGGTPAKSSEASVIVSVLDRNDNAPQIQVTLPQATVRENMKVGSYIAHLSPSDRDSNSNSQITCFVVDNDHFVLQKFSDTGSVFKVILNERLDYERATTEVVNVTCHDGGDPPLSNSTAFTLQVQDVNDNAPVFERPEYKAHIEERNHVGKFVAQIQARDPDDEENGNVTYSLIENSWGNFTINSLSGVIKAVVELDREEMPIYELTVQARDRGSPSLSANVKVTVEVDDLNDNPPFFPVPVIEMRIMENRPKNSIVGTVKAEDPDTGPNTNNRLRYSIKNNFEFPHLFALDRLSGVLYTQAPLDREERASYMIDVQVVDDSQPNFKAEAQVSVVVSDDNDHAPVFRFPGAIGPDNSTVQVTYARPAGSIIMTMAWEDDDSGENSTVSFSIATGDDAKLFFLHAVTGELMVARRMDSRDIGVHTLVVVARDGGVSFLETRRDLHVEVTSANGTLGFMDGDESSDANIAIVIALVCITAVLALAVLVTICIIRRIDRERKQHSSAKMEEENIYKQQRRPHHSPGSQPSAIVSGGGLAYKQAATSPGIPASPSARSSGKDNDTNFETELDKLRRKVKQDLSFGVEDDTSPLDASQSLSTKSASSFTTFKNNSSSSAGIMSPEKKTPSIVASRARYRRYKQQKLVWSLWTPGLQVRGPQDQYLVSEACGLI